MKKKVLIIDDSLNFADEAAVGLQGAINDCHVDIAYRGLEPTSLRETVESQLEKARDEPYDLLVLDVHHGGDAQDEGFFLYVELVREGFRDCWNTTFIWSRFFNYQEANKRVRDLFVAVFDISEDCIVPKANEHDAGEELVRRAKLFYDGKLKVWERTRLCEANPEPES